MEQLLLEELVSNSIKGIWQLKEREREKEKQCLL